MKRICSLAQNFASLTFLLLICHLFEHTLSCPYFNNTNEWYNGFIFLHRNPNHWSSTWNKYYSLPSANCFARSSIRLRSRSKIGFKYLPVYDFSTLATCSGVPLAIIVPPLSPPSGPKSIK